MLWTWDEIERNWLGGGLIAYPPDAVVDVFNRVEAVFGRDWLEASRDYGDVRAKGALPTLAVVADGMRLALLDGVPGAERLMDRLRQREEGSWSELTALYLLTSGLKGQEVECEPPTLVAGRMRAPDWRLRWRPDPWTYVEVTEPQTSKETARVREIMARLVAPIDVVKASYALEVFLRREPTEEEIYRLLGRITEVCGLAGSHEEELPDGLGRLFLNQNRPGEVVIDDHGEEYRPRQGLMRTRVGPNEPYRHIAVRLAFTDQRADRFLHAKARQLPNDTPGFVMIQMGRAPGGMKTWGSLIRSRLQPNRHTRVSGVCLFQSGFFPTPEGEAWRHEAELIVNPHAPIPLPPRVAKAIRRFEANSRSDASVA